MKTIHTTPPPLRGRGKGVGLIYKKKDDTNHSHRPLKE